MIAPGEQFEETLQDSSLTEEPHRVLLARYGRIPQVAWFRCDDSPRERGTCVVVQTDRGEELAMVLQASAPGTTQRSVTGSVLRTATGSDIAAATQHEAQTESSFPAWRGRIGTWKLQLQLLDMESTLDGRLIFYVLNDRGPETTRLALLAAAGGFGIVHVQPVSAEGIVTADKSSGCGSCGCSTEPPHK